MRKSEHQSSRFPWFSQACQLDPHPFARVDISFGCVHLLVPFFLLSQQQIANVLAIQIRQLIRQQHGTQVFRQLDNTYSSISVILSIPFLEILPFRFTCVPQPCFIPLSKNGRGFSFQAASFCLPAIPERSFVSCPFPARLLLVVLIPWNSILII